MKYVLSLLVLLAALMPAPAFAAEGVGMSEWMAVLQNPNVFFLLLSGALYGLLIEAAHPGMILPGAVGAGCLMLALAALPGMQVDHTGLALVVAGLGVMAAEAFLPAFGAFAIGGTISFVAGAVMMNNAGLGVSLWLVGGIAAINLAVVFFLLSVVLKARRQKPVTGREALISASAEVLSWANGKGEARAEGETWKARSDEPFIFAPGDKAVVTAVDGLTLVLVPAKNTQQQ